MNRDYHSDLICHFEVWHGLENRIKYEDKFDTKKAWDLRTKYIKDALIYAGKRDFNSMTRILMLYPRYLILRIQKSLMIRLTN